MTRSARRALSALTALIMTGTLFVGAPGPTYANGSDTYYVAQAGTPDGDGSSCTDPDYVGGDEGPINSAADWAVDGDTIYICAGTYAIENTIELGVELLTLQGAGAGVTILYGGANTQILDCTTATVSGLTFEDGDADGDDRPDEGGAINCTTVIVTNSIFIGNEAYADGGAIYGTTVTITNSTFRNNNTYGGGDGGAIWGENVTITNSTFVGNDADYGGAILADSGTLTVTNSLFIGNEAIYGGAIAGLGLDGTITVTNSTFVGNSATDGGAIGAITGTITRSRFRRNTARQMGGAVYLIQPISDDLRKLRGNTFRLNAAPLGGAISLNSCGTTVSRKKALRIERANLFLRNSATDQQRTKNIDRWSCTGA